MNRIVDYGNTTAKVGIFDQHVLIEKFTFPDDNLLQKFLTSTAPLPTIISTVANNADQLASWIMGEQLFILDSTLPLPIENLYGTPATLGMDRLAGVCGGVELFDKINTLIIDAGTCITYDFIDSRKKYYGGGISPGLQMRFKAVHTFTANLPMVETIAAPPLIGTSTATSIQSGVINGMVAEIEGLILRYQDKYQDLQVILCGGDASFFENQVKASIFASPELVLIGLNSILRYNVDL